MPPAAERRVRVGALGVALCLLSACSAGSNPDASAPTTPDPTTTAAAASSPAATTSAAPTTPPRPTLPDGSRQIFPGHRLVGFSGGPGSPALGRLTGDLDLAAEQLLEQAAAYEGSEPVLPVFELIATIAHPFPTPENDYSGRYDDDTIGSYLDVARRHGGILLLNIQPGTADFLPEVQAYERWLREPDVGVALDPEWAVEPGSVPGEVYGVTSGSELNEVASYLSGLVAAYDLPQKVMVYHQVAPQIVREEGDLVEHPGVAMVKSVDGIGSPGAKEATWRELMLSKPPFVVPGFKLFYDEDTQEGPLMTPPEVLALMPTPQYVLYE